MVVGPARHDRSPAGPAAQARQLGLAIGAIEELRLVHLVVDSEGSESEGSDGPALDGAVTRTVEALVVEPVGGWAQDAGDHRRSLAADTWAIDVGLRPGVTDREGAELVRAARSLGLAVTAASIGRRYLVSGADGVDPTSLAEGVLHNPVIERWSAEGLAPAWVPEAATPAPVELLPLRDLTEATDLAKVSAHRRLGLTVGEMAVIRNHFRDLDRDPTDAELETLAQTWSEHCAHKTFRARIATPDGVVDGLLATYLRAATEAIGASWVLSAFVDNAGIVSYDGRTAIAIKAETHNHPSALEPFGGANTGVGGVVRDILGVSARPIAITDILCFGPEDLPADRLPPGVLHPNRIRAGVVAGVGDYGNKIGVPTVGGAVLHDASYTTTPLVFAGCVGVLPVGSHPTEPRPGDAIVVLGGAVGRDGVGGATFSSQTMGVETALIAGSSVQIGDPIVEKGLIDVVVAARDASLYHAITDCGAGGLSSAVGEMAEGVGARVDLALVPRKYPGLAPWEVWLSEAQERMVLATDRPDEVIELARRWQVGADVIGHFTGDDRLVVTDGDTPVVDLDLGFLHGGRPRLELTAGALPPPRPPRAAGPALPDPGRALLALLAHPSIRSNEDIVRTFDHEVRGRTLIRPYGGVAGDGPADGTAIALAAATGEAAGTGTATPAIALGIGVNVVVGRYDTSSMAWVAIDEAIRNAVAAGADPDRICLLDNFAWSDPNDPAALAALVAACRGCHDAAIAYGAPFVSGKDSLYNEYRLPDGGSDPVTPTLVITALGPVDRPDNLPMTGTVTAGDDVWLVGPTSGRLGGSHLDDVLGGDRGGPLPAPDPAAPSRHRQLHAAIAAGVVRSVHDLAEGGLAVAAAEWALAGRLGLDLDGGALDGAALDGAASADRPAEILFGEGPARYLVETAPADRDRVAALLADGTLVGRVVDRPQLTIGPWLTIDLDQVVAAYTAHLDPPTAPPPTE